MRLCPAFVKFGLWRSSVTRCAPPPRRLLLLFGCVFTVAWTRHCPSDAVLFAALLHAKPMPVVHQLMMSDFSRAFSHHPFGLDIAFLQSKPRRSKAIFIRCSSTSPEQSFLPSCHLQCQVSSRILFPWYLHSLEHVLNLDGHIVDGSCVLDTNSGAQ